MVMHILKDDPALRDLKHVQVDGPGTAYLFFFDKQVCKGLTLEAAQTLRNHMGEAFTEWISHSAHFAVILFPLAERWCQAVTALEQHHQRSRLEYQGCPMMNFLSSESDSTPLKFQPPDQDEDPLSLTLLKTVLETHHHPLQSGQELIQMGILKQVRHSVHVTTEGGSEMRNVSHLCILTCQFLNRLTLMWM